MSNDTSQIGNRAWSFAHVLRDDGVSYLAYIEQIAFLLFLKMADKLARPPYNRKPIIPPELGSQPGMLGTIILKAKNEITAPADPSPHDRRRPPLQARRRRAR